MSKKGFTLVELLIVISIIGILASIILVSLNSARIKARDTRRVADLRQIAIALILYQDTKGKFPGTWGSNQWEVMAEELEKEKYLMVTPNDPLPTQHYEYWVSDDNFHFVLRATMENEEEQVLNNDMDGTVFGCDCDDTSGGETGTAYCFYF